MPNARFEIFTGKDHQFYFRLVAANNEIVLQSEGYTSRQGCEGGVNSVKANAPNEQRYQRGKSRSDQYYFVLKAANGEPIGRSGMYATEQGREKGIEAVRRAAAESIVE